MIAMSVAVIIPVQALADAFSPSTASKQRMMVQMVHCMKKRMSADKVISYNAAAKLCKTQVNELSNNSAAVALVAADSPAKP